MIQLTIDDEYKNYKKFVKKYSDKPYQILINRIHDKIDSFYDNLSRNLSIKKTRGIQTHI